MTEYSEPDAYARQGMGVAMLATALLFGLLEWVFSFHVPSSVLVVTFLLTGIVFLGVGTWEANKIIEEEINGD